MRILMLAHRIPYPPHTGDKVRAYHIARHLARRHEVTLAFLVDDAGDLGGVQPLREMVAHVEFARLWKPWSLGKGLAGLAAGASLSVPYFASRGLRRALRRRAEAAEFDVIYASSTPMAQYARALGRPLVMDFVDVDSDKWSQYGGRSRAPVSWLYHLEARRLRGCEAEIARWANVCVLATAPEAALLRSFAPWARTSVVPNGIDLEYFRPIPRDRAPAAVIFTGAMDYLPNIDAARYFCDEILPLVRREITDTRLFIVGLNPPAEVRRLERIPGVTVTGTVPDVRPYYARAGVCVAPLRMGRGVQNKVLQAMAMGLPVVASRVAHRGLEAEPGKHLHVEDDAAAFASRVVALLGDPAEQRAMARRARAFVEGNHAWDVSCASVETHLRAAAAAPAPALGTTA